MADRVGFSLGGPDGVLSHFLAQPLNDFHQWYAEALQEFPEEFDAERLRLLENIKQQGPIVVHDMQPSHVNFLLLDYYSSYANTKGILHDLHNYWDRLADHQLLVECLRQQGHSSSAELLKYTVTSRLSIPDASQILVDWRDYSLSFWTAEEVTQLKDTFDSMTEHDLLTLTDDERVQHALQTTREALEVAASRSTGLIIFVGW